MKRTAKPVFFIVALLILFLTYTSIWGISVQHGDNRITYLKGAGDIRWGIDIRGGVEATFSPDTTEEVTRQDMEAARSTIETRMVSNHITDYELNVDYDNQRIIVRFPWRSDETDFNPEEAINELAATALLTFREGDEHASEEMGEDGSIEFCD